MVYEALLDNLKVIKARFMNKFTKGPFLKHFKLFLFEQISTLQDSPRTAVQNL
jgi:hypothetical protein